MSFVPHRSLTALCAVLVLLPAAAAAKPDPDRGNGNDRGQGNGNGRGHAPEHAGPAPAPAPGIVTVTADAPVDPAPDAPVVADPAPEAPVVTPPAPAPPSVVAPAPAKTPGARGDEASRGHRAAAHERNGKRSAMFVFRGVAGAPVLDADPATVTITLDGGNRRARALGLPELTVAPRIVIVEDLVAVLGDVQAADTVVFQIKLPRNTTADALSAGVVGGRLVDTAVRDEVEEPAPVEEEPVDEGPVTVPAV